MSSPYLYGIGDATPQVNGQLPDEGEAGGVANIAV